MAIGADWTRPLELVPTAVRLYGPAGIVVGRVRVSWLADEVACTSGSGLCAIT